MNANNTVLEGYAVLMSSKNQKVILERNSRDYELLIGSHRELFVGTNSQCLSFRTKGERFKEKFGYSLTMHKNLRKQGLTEGVNSIPVYKQLRKQRKKEQKHIQKAKHDAALGGRGKASVTPKSKK